MSLSVLYCEDKFLGFRQTFPCSTGEYAVPAYRLVAGFLVNAGNLILSVGLDQQLASSVSAVKS